MRELSLARWWPAATLVALVAAGTIAVSSILLVGGGSDDQVRSPVSRSPAATNAGTATRAADVSTPCPTNPADGAEDPTLFDTLSEDTVVDPPNFEASFAAEVGNDLAHTSADLTLDMDVRTGNVAVSAFYVLIPEEWNITPGCQIPIGFTVGKLRWDANLGLDGKPCSQPGPLQFTMLNASTDPSDTVEFHDSDGNGDRDFAEDKDGSGRADVLEKYPRFLTRLFPDRRPVRRSAGIFSYVDPPVLAQSLLFPTLDESSDGTTLVLVLQDIGDPEAVPGESGFTDYCTPSGFRMTDFGSTVNGGPFYTNPGAGEYTFTLTSFGERDAEGDGIENALDTCPFDVNVGNPRVTGDGDADDDGLDAACDPSDFETDPDQDGDGHLNRVDMCPLTKGESPDQRDADEDDIGDECDESGNGPDVADGEVPLIINAADVTIR